MKYLYFVRHGLSEMNKQGTWSGNTDTPLAPKGHEQAKAAGLRAKQQGLAFDAIVSSPLQRAHHTAQHIATHTGYDHDKIVLNDLLKERGFGALEGTRNIKAGAEYLLSEQNIDKYDNVESLENLQKRADQALAYLQSLDYDTVLVVAHGAFGRALYRAVNQLPITQRNVKFHNAEIIKFL